MKVVVLLFLCFSAFYSNAGLYVFGPYISNTSITTAEQKDSQLYVNFDGDLDTLPSNLQNRLPFVTDTRQKSEEITFVTSKEATEGLRFESTITEFTNYRKQNGEYIEEAPLKSVAIGGLWLEGDISESNRMSNVVVYSPQEDKDLELAMKKIFESAYQKATIYNKTFFNYQPISFEDTLDFSLNANTSVVMNLKGNHTLTRIEGGFAYFSEQAHGVLTYDGDDLAVEVLLDIEGELIYSLKERLIVSEKKRSTTTISESMYDGILNLVTSDVVKISRKRTSKSSAPNNVPLVRDLFVGTWTLSETDQTLMKQGVSLTYHHDGSLVARWYEDKSCQKVEEVLTGTWFVKDGYLISIGGNNIKTEDRILAIDQSTYKLRGEDGSIQNRIKTNKCID